MTTSVVDRKAPATLDGVVMGPRRARNPRRLTAAVLGLLAVVGALSLTPAIRGSDPAVVKPGTPVKTVRTVDTKDDMGHVAALRPAPVALGAETRQLLRHKPDLSVAELANAR